LAKNELSCLWQKPGLSREYRSATSLHSHTHFSRESLHFIAAFARNHRVSQWALDRKARQSRVQVDLSRAYRTPPLRPQTAFEVERNQIETVLGVAALVALTDHDTIEAPDQLRGSQETREIPFSLEWSVPYEDAIFHLGVHNLPASRAHAIVADLAAHTQHPSGARLTDLLGMLDDDPDVLIVFNHPLWNLCWLDQQRCEQLRTRFLSATIPFLHAFELNATCSRAENNGVIELAGQWRRLLISAGDRHGCEPSGAVNLTRAEGFCEFVHEVRVEQRSHVLFMPQYDEPLGLRTTATALDVIREYPDYAPGCRRWDDRVFHPDQDTDKDQPVSAYWKTPPGFIERIFSVMRLMENASVRRAVQRVCRAQCELNPPHDLAHEPVYEVVASTAPMQEGI
jgi:hypothetical protein